MASSAYRPLVFGGTGSIGREIVRTLAGRGVPVAATVRDVAKAKAILPPAVRLVTADFGDAASMQRAAEQVQATSVYLYSAALTENTLAALKAAGVRRVVLISTCFIDLPFSEPLAIAEYGARLEALVKAAGFHYTALRADSFQSNALRWASEIEQGTVKWMLNDAACRQVAPEDIAEVAADALATRDYDNVATVTIQGPELISTRQQVDIMARVLKRHIQLVEQSREEYTAEHSPAWRELVIQAVYVYSQYRLQHPDEQAPTDKLVTGRVTFKQYMQKHSGFLQE